MRRPRYLMLVGDAGLDDAAMATEAALRPVGSFRRCWRGPRGVVFAEGPVMGFDHGVVVGNVFRRGSTDPLQSLSPSDGSLLLAGTGQFLLDAHWGGYIALIARERHTTILRAPLGDLPCLFAQAGNLIAIASDLALLALAGCAVDTDYGQVARHLASPDIRHRATCIAGVSELQGGLRLECNGAGREIVEAWTPWRFAETGRQLNDVGEACARVRDAVDHAVAASCRLHKRVVLRLSGGLDSSIVASSLVRAGIPVIAMNFVTRDAGGDERRYARMVAEHLGIALEERMREIDKVDLARSDAAGVPRPSARAFVQAGVGAAFALAREIGAEALVDGGGGDNIFCSLQSVRPVADRIAAGKPWRDVRDTARSVARLAEVSEWTVLRRAWLSRVRRTSRFVFPLELRFLSADAVDHAAGAGDHRWLDPPPGSWPGKAAHVGLVAAAQSVVESFDPRQPIPFVSPLISQPVVEACLRVPAWLWYDRGRNRAIARRAFADRLPPAIVTRRSKGGPDGFIAELYRANRRLVREMLLDGRLAGNGVLDRPALEAALAEEGPARGSGFFRIMQLVDTEAWARSR